MDNKLHFCTLFDSFYLSRGLALYNSLKVQKINFKLYVLAFDKLTFEILKDLKLENLIVIPLEELETQEVLKVKKARTRGEYCWTFTPRIINYIMKNYEVDMCTYLDADIYFFDTPQILIDEIVKSKDRDVLITSHNYHKEYDQKHISGEYCVQFVTFKNNENGLKILEWWEKSCLEWCYARLENGKYGDQKYLEQFNKKFKNVYVSRELGAGLAPWNTKRFIHSDGYIMENNLRYRAIFYHYQALKIDMNYKVLASSLDLGSNTIELYYLKYIDEIKKINNILKKKYGFESGLLNRIDNKLKLEMIFRNIKYDVIRSSKAYNLSLIKKSKFLISRLSKVKKIYEKNNFEC